MKKVHFIDVNRSKSWSLAIFSDNEPTLRFQIVGQTLMLPHLAGYAYNCNYLYPQMSLVVLEDCEACWFMPFYSDKIYFFH